MSLPLHNERELLRQIADGDSDAFKTLHHQHWSDLYYLALSFLKSPDWALDIVQDVFLKLWVKRESLPGIENLTSYLFIITRNELISAMESRARTLKRQHKYNQSLPDDFLRPDNRFTFKELETLVHKAVEQLPPKQRQMFKLTRQQGLTHDQIAAELGISRQTVANTLTSALNSIRSYLHRHGCGSVPFCWLFFALFPHFF